MLAPNNQGPSLGAVGITQGGLMRAVMTATVSMVPGREAAASEAPVLARRHASREEIREALTTVGLTPPPLVRYRDKASGRALVHEDESALFRDLTRVV